MYRGLHVHRESVVIVQRSRAISFRPVPNPTVLIRNFHHTVTSYSGVVIPHQNAHNMMRAPKEVRGSHLLLKRRRVVFAEEVADVLNHAVAAAHLAVPVVGEFGCEADAQER
jgi:hypothetical protein